jgi:energy-coupling factor transporter transmembrane protein EcfT
MAGNLFLRGFERSDRIYTAMLSRGYDGEVRLMPARALNNRNKFIGVPKPRRPVVFAHRF